MPYADSTYYSGDFGGSMTQEEFAKMSAKASCLIDVQTFDRAASAPAVMQTRLKNCCCELAERLLSLDAADRMTQGGIISRVDTDGESASYDAQAYPQVKDVAADICRQQLSYPVNLVYRG